jgi:hypothetical protein
MTDRVLEGTTALALTAIIAVIVISYTTAMLAGRLTGTILGHLLHGEQSPTGAAATRGPVRLVRGVTFAALMAVLTFPALDLAGVDTAFGLTSATLTAWRSARGSASRSSRS